MNSWNENFTENWLFCVLVFRNFAVPQSPFVLLHIPIVIIAKTTFREFDFDQRSKDSIEFVKNLVVILSTSYATSISPHSSKNEECLIDNFMVFLLLFRAIDADNIFVLFD